MTDSECTVAAPRPVVVPMPAAPAVEEIQPGTRAGDCVILRAIASGGCGVVYEAEHVVFERTVAVKVLHRRLVGHASMVTRFFREARVVDQLRHPNIVEVYGFGELHDGRPYFVMELLPGENLGAILRRQGRFSPREALAYLEPVCSAVGAAHRANVVHRDLKASNVAVLREGEPPVVKLLDFGIAKLLRPEPGDRALTAVGQRVGTPLSMSPEQLLGDTIGPATDIYAIGALLFRMLTGAHVFHGRDLREIERLHLHAPPPRPSAFAPVSPQLDAVVLRCMAKRPEDRYASVDELITALREAVGGSSVSRASASSNAVRRAVILYLQVDLFDGIEEDDAHLAALGALLDAAEAEIAGAGFRLRRSTGVVIWAEQVLSDNPLDERGQRRRALALARRLYGLAEPLRAGGRGAVSVHVHAGPADAAVVGGSTSAGGLYATRAVLDGILPEELDFRRKAR